MKQPARIHIEHTTIKSVPCVKILGFEGIKVKDELPVEYVGGTPSFHMRDAYWNVRKFNGERVTLGEDASCFGVTISLPDGINDDELFGGYSTVLSVGDVIEEKVFGGYSTVLSVGDVIEEKAFREIITWLKRAGSRLAKIRRKEAEKKNCEWVEI